MCQPVRGCTRSHPFFATNWTGAESPMSQVVYTDPTPPVNNITVTGIVGGAYLSGATVYYRGSVAGSFTLTNAVTDADSGPASSSTSALGGTARPDGRRFPRRCRRRPAAPTSPTPSAGLREPRPAPPRRSPVSDRANNTCRNDGHASSMTRRLLPEPSATATATSRVDLSPSRSPAPTADRVSCPRSCSASRRTCAAVHAARSGRGRTSVP